MALFAAAGAAIVGAATSFGGITAAVVTNNRHTKIKNSTSRVILVTVDGEEVKISPGVVWKFKVKQATPIRIKVRYDRGYKRYEEVSVDAGHDDYRVLEFEGNLVLEKD